MKVGLVDLPSQYLEIKDEINDAIHQVMVSAQFILGPTVSNLEEQIAEYSGAKYAVGVNSGTDALLLALVAHRFNPGDEIITSPFTFVATAEAIALAGLKPVFADIDPQTFNIDPEAIKRVITPRTRAIMPVDLFGQMADRTAIIEIAEQNGLELIWDAAQAIGGAFANKQLGEWTGSATLSFFPTKNLGGCGDGGMILTNSESIRDGLRKYRFHGSGGGYVYDRVGYCSRLDALQAAIIAVKLPHLESWNNARRRNADLYYSRLKSANVLLPFCDPRAHHIYHQYTVRSNHRDALKLHLKSRGVDTGIYYPLALHLQKAYESLDYKPGAFPHAENATQTVLSIPIHPGLTEEQVHYVADSICEFSP